MLSACLDSISFLKHLIIILKILILFFSLSEIIFLPKSAIHYSWSNNYHNLSLSTSVVNNRIVCWSVPVVIGIYRPLALLSLPNSESIKRGSLKMLNNCATFFLNLLKRKLCHLLSYYAMWCEWWWCLIFRQIIINWLTVPLIMLGSNPNPSIFAKYISLHDITVRLKYFWWA